MFSFILVIFLGVGVAGSRGKSMFNLLRSFQTVPQSSRTIKRSHQQHVRVPVFRVLINLSLVAFWMTAFLAGVKSCPVILICMSLVAEDYFYKCFY